VDSNIQVRMAEWAGVAVAKTVAARSWEPLDSTAKRVGLKPYLTEKGHPPRIW
jgi:hypothetical protein